MTSEFLSVGKIPKKLTEFSNMWFEFAQQLEELSNFKSGFDGGFKSSLKGLLSDGERCGLFIDDICISSQHHMPGRKEDFEESRKNIVGAFDELRQVFENDIDFLDRHESLATKTAEMEKRLVAVTKQYQDVKSLALKSCSHYETFKKEYERKIHNIKEATNENIRAIQKRFMDDVTTIFEGYKIFSIEKNDEIGLELFFERMIKDPDYPEKVNIVSRGLSFGKKKSDIKARLVLLKYQTRDITNELAPLLDAESRRVERFQPELKRLHELEMRCTELRDEDDRLSTLKNVIESDLDALNAEDKDTRSKFQTYESLLELRDSYLKTFNSTASFRKELSDLITRSFEEYEPIEPDVEKRELKEDIKGLNQNIAALKNDKTKILELFEHTQKELEESRAELINRADTIASIIQERNALKTELEKTSNTLSKTIEERDGLKKENNGLNILLKETGESVSELEKLKDSIENKLLKTASDLEKTLDKRDGLAEAKKKVEDRALELANANKKLKNHLEDTSSKLEVTIEKLQEKETTISELEKLKDSTESKRLKTASDLEKTLDERDGLVEAKKKVEDSVVELMGANEKLKKHLEDASSKLEVAIEKLQEKETAISDIEKSHARISTKQAQTTTAKKPKKIIAAPSDKTVVKKKIEALREKKRK